MKPRLKDLFCGAGLAADGYFAAGFDPYGEDIESQPYYPYRFFCGDAMEWLAQPGPDADAIHASPPCQLFTRAKHLRDAQGSGSKETVDLLTPTLALLRERWGNTPWVVENVEAAAPFMAPLGGQYLARLCGSAFGLEVQRHRLFLSNVPLTGTECQHDRFPPDPITGKPRPWGVYHAPNDSIPRGGRTARDADHARELFGLTRSLPWDSIKEGFPPAYTKHIGRQLLAAIGERAA